MMIFDWVRICDRIGHARDVTRPACDRALPTPRSSQNNSQNQRPSFFGIRNRPSDVIAKFVVLGNGSDAMSGTNKFREINYLAC